jgi:hypothetical protein
VIKSLNKCILLSLSIVLSFHFCVYSLPCIGFPLLFLFFRLKYL